MRWQSHRGSTPTTGAQPPYKSEAHTHRVCASGSPLTQGEMCSRHVSSAHPRLREVPSSCTRSHTAARGVSVESPPGGGRGRLGRW
nr:MAG TPA: hypothetical protein [Caudoviricetes sp.]